MSCLDLDKKDSVAEAFVVAKNDLVREVNGHNNGGAILAEMSPSLSELLKLPPGPACRAMIAKTGVRLALLLAIGATIGCDRVTKHVAATTLAGTPSRSFFADTVRLEYVENAGGFLSLGATLPPAARTALFTVGTGLSLLVLIGVAIRYHWNGWPLLGLSLFVAGGASNWIDRVVRGSVVDFINVGIGPVRTGIFNVADVAILLGVVIFVSADLRWGKQAQTSTSDRPT